MPLVECKCTNCGAVLKVDSAHDAAVCEFCKTPFIVQKAINNFNNINNISDSVVNIYGGNSQEKENLIKRMLMFVEEGKREQALQYSERVLDMDPECAEAYLCKLLVSLNIRQISDLEKLQEPFDRNENYLKVIKYSDELGEKIKRANNIVKKESVYKSAVKLTDENSKSVANIGIRAQRIIEKNEQAIKLFESIVDWKDSRTKIDECKAKIEEIKIAEEKAEAERKRKAEEARITVEKTKAKNKKIAIICVLIVTALIVFLIVFLPANNYKKALAAADEGNYSEAYSLFSKYPKYKDSDSKISESKTLYLKSLMKESKVGDIIIFGVYEQDNDASNGKEEIEWRVLAKEGNKILIISKYALDCKEYNTEYTDVTWETCMLRKWLNDTFINTAFSNEKQKLIPSETITADTNPSYSTNPGNDTKDKVFLLSITETEKYFSSDDDRMCVPTAYAIEQGAYTSSSYTKDGKATCLWWMRSPGYNNDAAARVDEDGVIGDYGYLVGNSVVCVRPAMWIEF